MWHTSRWSLTAGCFKWYKYHFQGTVYYSTTREIFLVKHNRFRLSENNSKVLRPQGITEIYGNTFQGVKAENKFTLLHLGSYLLAPNSQMRYRSRDSNGKYTFYYYQDYNHTVSLTLFDEYHRRKVYLCFGKLSNLMQS